MPRNTIQSLDATNTTFASVALGMRGDRQGTVNEQVHDGDTIVSRAVDNFGIRFLGIDTAEVSFSFPGTKRFVSLKDPQWNDFLQAPFDARWPAFEDELDPQLVAALKAKVQPDCGSNHALHAERATQFLREQVQHDLREMGHTTETFRMYLVFAHEVMDGYGRFLAYANRDQPDRNKPTPRPLTYNERMLQSGLALPYFIWPNINPFRKATSIMAAVVPPGGAKTLADQDSALSRARQWVKSARSRHLGVFDAMQPLQLEPFELRFLARRESLRRWVIDLGRNDDVLLRPENYHTIPWPEERLYIPEEYVPLFVSKGWKTQA